MKTPWNFCLISSLATTENGIASQFNRRSSRSNVVSTETKSQFDQRVNDYKNYSFATV